MLTRRQLAPLNRTIAGHHAGRINRRRVVGVFGALGLSAAATPWLLGRGAAATTAPGGHAGHLGVAAVQQEAPPAATPQLGEQPDGSFTHKVVAGGGAMEEMIELLAFFPTEITVNAGDSVYWEVRGFHNVHFLSGAPLPQVIVPAAALPGMGSPAASPAGGPPQLVLNPDVMFPSGGTTYDGTGIVNSGVALDPTAPPFVLTFGTPGEYEYYCTVHGEVMEGRVVVQEQGAERPMDQAAIDQRGADEMNALLEEARALIAGQGGMASPAAAGDQEVLAGLSQGQVEVNAFFPRQLTISAGDTVRFNNPTTQPPVPHTVTFIGGGAAPEFVVPQPSSGGPPVLALNPKLVAPAGGSYSGQGFANSGLLVAGGGPTTYELTFDTPGEYRYYCAIHAGGPDEELGMTGIITVS